MLFASHGSLELLSLHKTAGQYVQWPPKVFAKEISLFLYQIDLYICITYISRNSTRKFGLPVCSAEHCKVIQFHWPTTASFVRYNNDNYWFHSPNIDEPQVSAVTAGFGGALTTALDMMAFAHDIDLSTATEGIPTNVDAKQMKAKAANDEQINSTLNMPSTNIQSADQKLIVITNEQQNQRSDSSKKPAEPDIREMNLKNSSCE